MTLLKLLGSLLFGWVTDLRRVLYDHEILPVYQSSLPVVSVGNLTVGGNGKSPFVSFLAEGLLARGFHPVVLLRGYRGSERGPYRVLRSDTPARVGDEALMHAKRFGDSVPVVVAGRRAAGAKVIETLQLGDVILLDDGFQHQALSRECDLVLWAHSDRSPRAELEQARFLPLGRLRERILPALRRAHALVWVQKGESANFSGPFPEFPNLLQFRFELFPQTLRDVYSGDERGLSVLKGQSCRCLASIATPQSFSHILTAVCGAQISKSLFKSDHDRFSAHEWQQFSATGEGIVICTEKDEEKLSAYLRGPGELYSLRLMGELLGGDEEFFRFLQEILSNFAGSSPVALAKRPARAGPP